MGRLWQTLILSQWNPLLAQLPVESMVHEHQNAYYQAINLSTKKTDSEPFIEFMLGVIVETIASNIEASTPQVRNLITLMAKQTESLNRDQLQQSLSLKDRKSFRERYLKPALEAGFIEMTIPDKPNSRLQQYSLTKQGRNLVITFS